MLHDVGLQGTEIWGTTEVDGVAFRDDWGTPDGRSGSAGDVARHSSARCTRNTVAFCTPHDKFVFFHSDGDISDIFGDLVKLEIDAIHSQLRLMNVERLAKRVSRAE